MNRNADAPNDQWDDVEQYPPGDIRTLRKQLELMHADACAECRACVGRGSVAGAFARGRAEGLEGAMVALDAFEER